MIVTINAECKCGNVLGTHCGSRMDYGFLSTGCSRTGLYGCKSINAVAQYRGECHGCADSGPPGNDFCPSKIGKLFN